MCGWRGRGGGGGGGLLRVFTVLWRSPGDWCAKISFETAIFVLPWLDNAQTQPKQQTYWKEAIWLVHRLMANVWIFLGLAYTQRKANGFTRYKVAILIMIGQSNKPLPILAVIKDYGDVSPWKKATGAAKRQSGHQKISNLSACKAQGNQHEIRIAFFKRN